MKMTALKMTKLSSYIEESTANLAAVVRMDWIREDCIAGALRGTSSCMPWLYVQGWMKEVSKS